jgi:hypothetical protein
LYFQNPGIKIANYPSVIFHVLHANSGGENGTQDKSMDERAEAGVLARGLQGRRKQEKGEIIA